MFALEGTPSDDLAAVLDTGTTDVRLAVVSMSARHPEGMDQSYIEWHSLDHAPEQYRIPGVRGALRVVSTPACRAARAASDPEFDAVDHVMTYLFAGPSSVSPFHALGAALREGGRMPIALPAVNLGSYDLAGTVAAPRAKAGADVLPWRPARGVYVLLERGVAEPAELVNVPGVAGAWWYDGHLRLHPNTADTSGLRLTLCYLDDDPVATAGRLAGVLEQRWASGDIVGLLAAPFHTLVPYAWDRYLP